MLRDNDKGASRGGGGGGGGGGVGGHKRERKRGRFILMQISVNRSSFSILLAESIIQKYLFQILLSCI